MNNEKFFLSCHPREDRDLRFNTHDMFLSRIN
jgi:hypothetical protein